MTNTMKIDYFNRLDFGKRYEEQRAQNQAGWFNEDNYNEKKLAIDKLVARYNIPKGARFLDLGCGAGNITLFMASKGFDAYGVDTAHEAIEWAQEKMENPLISADFRVGSIVDLAAYTDDFFDFLLISSSTGNMRRFRINQYPFLMCLSSSKKLARI